MDQTLQQYPLLSFILSQINPTSHPPLPHESLQNLITRFPHLQNPNVVSALSNSIPITVAQTQSLLSSLGPRPDPAAVESARSRIAQIESSGESEKEAEIYRAVVRLNDMHEGYERQLREVEEKLVAAYGPAVEELEKGSESEEVNEEVIAILKKAETEAVEKVDLSERELRFLPEAFGRIHGLVMLDLSRNQFQVIPDSIAGLQKLEELDLSSNLLESLPDSVGFLLNLRVLNVSGNKLSSLPESIARCSSLVELDASFNNLMSLPTNFGYGLGRLERLSIQLNKVRSLPPSICEIQSLRYLDAHFNEIRGLPHAIGRLTNLQVLNLSSNFSDLTELPETLGDLISLRELDLSNNQIRALPDTFHRLLNLTQLNLDQNPLEVPPSEVVREGVQAVKEYMAKRWDEMIAEEQKRILEENNQQEVQSGWLAWGTSLVGNVVSGVSQTVTGYLGGGKAPRDPWLDQQL